jgi:hypothetical protein
MRAGSIVRAWRALLCSGRPLSFTVRRQAPGVAVMSPPILCSTHEHTPTDLVCDHIAAAIRLPCEMPTFQRPQVALGWLQIVPYICEACMVHFALTREVRVPLEGDLDQSVYPNLVPVCSKCLEALDA